jgi:hypothetical protein
VLDVDQENQGVVAPRQDPVDGTFSDFKAVGQLHRRDRVFEVLLSQIVNKTDMMRFERYRGKLGVLQECADVACGEPKSSKFRYDRLDWTGWLQIRFRKSQGMYFLLTVFFL